MAQSDDFCVEKEGILVMRRVKRVLSVLLAVALVIGCFPFTAFAAGKEKKPFFERTVVSEDNLNTETVQIYLNSTFKIFKHRTASIAIKYSNNEGSWEYESQPCEIAFFGKVSFGQVAAAEPSLNGVYSTVKMVIFNDWLNELYNDKIKNAEMRVDTVAAWEAVVKAWVDDEMSSALKDAANACVGEFFNVSDLAGAFYENAQTLHDTIDSALGAGSYDAIVGSMPGLAGIIENIFGFLLQIDSARQEAMITVTGDESELVVKTAEGEREMIDAVRSFMMNRGTKIS